MKKTEKILMNVQDSKELQKDMKKLYLFSDEEFINNANRYIKAIKEGRMCCVIDKVSASGMSRNIKFLECSKGRGGYRFYNFCAFFTALGYTRVNNSDTFRIGGCGMDMIFHTNYTIIHRLHRLGFINKKECARLAQDTPSVL